MFYERNPFDFVYDADETRPGTDSQPNTSNDLRLTWQMSPEEQAVGRTTAMRRARPITGSSATPGSRRPRTSKRSTLNHFETLTFKSTINSRMLLDLGFGNTTETWTREPVQDSAELNGVDGRPHDSGHRAELTGVNFRAYSGTFSENYTSVRSYKGSMSYVPGSHNMKFGFNLVEGPAETPFLDRPRHGHHRPQRRAALGDGPHDAVCRATSVWWPTSACTRRIPGR